MKISYIIPAYNEEKYIEQCVRSVLDQKHIADFEVIVVDNNSKDKTAELVRDKFPQVLLVREKRQGMTIARNRGAKEAAGDILVFFDADVIVPSHWEGRMLEQFLREANLAGVSGPYRFYDLPRRYKYIEFLTFHVLFPVFGEFLLKKVFRKGTLWVGGNMAVKKDVFFKVGGFDEGIVFYGEDADLARKLFQEGNILFSRNLWVGSSARRLLKGGPLKESSRYVFHYLWYFLTGRSRAKSYEKPNIS